MVAQGSGHGQAARPDTEGSYRAPLHSTRAELPAKLSQALALGFVVIQSVVAAHLDMSDEMLRQRPDLLLNPMLMSLPLQSRSRRHHSPCKHV